MFYRSSNQHSESSLGNAYLLPKVWLCPPPVVGLGYHHQIVSISLWHRKTKSWIGNYIEHLTKVHMVSSRWTDHFLAWPKQHNAPNQHFYPCESAQQPGHIFQSSASPFQAEHLRSNQSITLNKLHSIIVVFPLSPSSCLQWSSHGRACGIGEIDT